MGRDSRVESLEMRTMLSGAGTLDSAFGHDGFAYVLNQAPANVRVTASLPLSGGKTLIIGLDFAGRLNANGSIDTTFADHGFLYSSNIGGPATVDGKGRLIFVNAGSFTNDQTVTRYSADGKQDTSFEHHFLAFPAGTQPLGDLTCVTAGPDGSIYLGGSVFAAKEEFGVVKLESNGVIDKTFGDDGLATTRFDTEGDSEIETIALDGRGRIIAAGGGNGFLDLARFNRDGSLDDSFGHDGRTRISASSEPAADQGLLPIAPAFRALVIGDDGNIFAAGGWDTTDPAIGHSFPLTVAAFDLNGHLRDRFGLNGVLRVVVGSRGGQPSQAVADGLVLNSKGQLIVDGTVDLGGITGVLLARINHDGTLDKTFATALPNAPKAAAGVRFIASSANPGLGNLDLGLQALHGAKLQIPLVNGGISLERLDANGNPDLFFGTSGLAAVTIPAIGANTPDQIFTTASDPRATYVTTDDGQTLNRIAPGERVTKVGDSLPNEERFLAMQGDGKRLVADNRDSNQGNASLVRYNADGSIDRAFGVDGRLRFTVGGSSFVEVESLILRADGAMFVDVNQNVEGQGAGGDELDSDALHLVSGTGQDVASVNAGPGITDIGTGSALVDFNVDPDGKLVVSTFGPHPPFRGTFSTQVLRFDGNDLSPDATFGNNGVVDLGSLREAKVASTSDRGTILSSYETDSHNHKLLTVLRRLSSDGQIDASFGQNGVAELAQASTVFDPFGLGLNNVLVQSDGKLLVTSDTVARFNRVAVITRLDSNGAIDPAFGEGGSLSLLLGEDAAQTDFGETPMLFALSEDRHQLLIACEVGPRHVPFFNARATVASVARVNL